MKLTQPKEDAMTQKQTRDRNRIARAGKLIEKARELLHKSGYHTHAKPLFRAEVRINAKLAS